MEPERGKRMHMHKMRGVIGKVVETMLINAVIAEKSMRSR